MKYFLLILILWEILGCVNQAETSKISLPSNTIPPSSYESVPLRWESSKIPLTMNISENFSADEKQKMEEMQFEWNNSGAGQTFFSGVNPAVPNKALTYLEDYYDNEFGIYKLTTWFDEIGEDALAVTQFFAKRHNVGTPSEFLEIVHVDILFNNKNFNFATDGSFSKYDLPSIALHELGHVLGLKHERAHDSIMYPYLSSGTLKRSLKPFDIESIGELYGNFIPSSLNIARSALKTLPQDEGKIVRGIVEISASGKEKIYFLNFPTKDFTKNIK